MIRKPLLFKRESMTAILPKKAKEGDAGYDLFADLGIGQEVTVFPSNRLRIPTNIAVATPDGTYMRIAPRSGLADKFGIDTMAGVIDQGYRGTIGVILFNTGTTNFVVKHGDKIAQGIIEYVVPTEVLEVDELPPSERGGAGFGSTGR